MPLYEYICRDCGKISEFRESLSERDAIAERVCTNCGSKNLVQYFGNMIVISSTHLH